MSEIKTGMRFKNAGMDVEVLDFAEGKETNVALLLCHSDGLYITVRNLQLWNGGYVWLFGNYISNKQDAIDDYEKRKNDM